MQGTRRSGTQSEDKLTEREAKLEQRERAVEEVEAYLREQKREHLCGEIAKDNKYLFVNPGDKYYQEVARKNVWELRRLHDKGGGSPNVLEQPMQQRLWVPRPDG